ncbi:peptide deformylase [Rhodobacter sphaeroides]|jgi:peptide deformylase|uniref:Peptide deformylase-like n=1 Tax=Cereibacter sphaeroides (strain ATCC 17023 / DSM 158 / JCM 6121 / CCUG 31486 / LMG 2827 / NBRC 12203 / NCIMB 8253 / ATH 2.4.1.) TaxID=272943 RepID=Q3IZH7_CERS4|nr:peptide deformylase [Cereibacter sphaeroides]ABA80057.1 Formylmethionine deformylase [Cereibacter sphaeroides 2.4.1]AMJ48308.1 peptide deformylase [Cereibacter sphaeroides]ANS35027.1 peptide deformylase [Cereibacter sphaeroides]ATN64077.1 peptide deformylase [Cereibacter sphaeroides]AXC62256.1 peptide deformylase [Cereibacter sphaeroides 2.4.1]
MIRPFVMYPDKRLKTVATPVEAVTDEIRAIWTDMIETMDAMPGYGLAAPQIGVMLRLAVVDCSENRGKAIRLANPEILHASGQFREHEEGSPNLPGASAVISRPRAVTVRFLNEAGEIEERDFVDIWATSVQHQIDHLNGRLYIDRLSPLKRKMVVAKSEKYLRRVG